MSRSRRTSLRWRRDWPGATFHSAATIFSNAIGAAIAAADGTILTGHTYSWHTAACAAGLAVQRIIETR